MRTLGPSGTAETSYSLFQQLALITSGPVCHNLRHLTWTFPFRWDRMRLFLSSRLVSVIIRELPRHGSTTSRATPEIHLIPTTHLEELRLEGGILPPTHIHPALSEVVQRLDPCFKRLSIKSPLTDAAWEHLASLPKLELLEVSDTPRTEISKSMPHELIFPALKSMVVVVADRYQGWPSLFSLLESSPLREVAILGGHGTQCGDVPSQVTFAMLAAGLHQRVEGLAITRFDLAHLTFLSHLGPFRSLKTLQCNPRCRGSEQCISTLTDSNIEQLASALPQLVTLCLGHRCEYSLHQTTIKSMISLSTHCLSLETLYLPCDLRNIREDVKVESGEPDPRLEIRSLCPLKALLCRCAIMPPVGDFKARRMVASALRHLFPLLESIEG